MQPRKGFGRAVSVASMAVGLLVGPSAVQAQSVTAAGDNFYTNPVTSPVWNAGAQTYIGNTGVGTLAVNAGGIVTGTTLEIGHAAGSNGLVSVDGAGSALSASNSVTVGAAGTGSLAITNGATASFPNGSLGTTGSMVIGSAGGSNGTVMIDGSGSHIQAGDIMAGYLAGSNGSLTISGGGSVTASRLRLGGVNGGTNGGSGSLAVTGAGSILNVGGGGTFIGGSAGATGTAIVSDGGQFNDAITFLGFNGASASLTVTGVGSNWTDSSTARIGYSDTANAGTGTVIIQNGATASVLGAAAAFGLGNGTGSLLVTGAGSEFTSSGPTYVGYGIGADPGSASGTITIANGGSVQASSVILGFNAASASGTVNIGAASGNAAVAPGSLNASTLTFGPGTGVLNFNHTSTDGSYAFAAAISSGAGSATINQLAGVTILTGNSGSFGKTTNVVGGTLGVSGSLGNTSSIMNVTNGTLAVSNGGTVNASSAAIGNGAGTTGTGTVSGVNSLLQAGVIRVGSQTGTGILTIDAGATASAAKVTVGGTSTGDNVSPGGTGTLNVSGIGSTLNQTSAGGGFFLGGEAGNGTVLVSNGGTLNSATMFLAFAGGNGTLTVDGAGSQWNNSGASRVGYGSGGISTGAVNVENGATATNSGFALFGLGGGGAGTLNVNGAGSTYSVATGAPYSLTLGYGYSAGVPANGTMTISDGGTVNAPVTNITLIDPGLPGPATGTVNIGAAAGSVAAAPGTLNSPNVIFGGGTGTLNFNHTSLDGTYAFAAAISSSTGNSTINQIAGNTNLTGDSSAFGGTTNVTGGTLRVNGTLGNAASDVNVSNTGTLGGSGTIGGNVVIADGILAPGNSPGTLTINGNLTLAAASQLNYELGAANTVGGPLNDLTIVNGNLTLDGTLNVTQSAGGTYGAGIYRLINYAGTLTNNGLDLGSMPAGSINYVQTSVTNQVNLVNSNGLTLNYWDGDAGGRNDGMIAGGNGTWVAATPGGTDNWTKADGLINAPYQDGAFAVFTGAPGTVTVNDGLGAVRVSGMQFATSGYLIQGDPITLLGGTNAIRVGDGTASGATTTATIASALIGTGKLDKVDLGTLILTGANTYSGGTTISAGTLQMGNGGTSGSIIGDVLDNAVLAFNRSDAVAFNGAISGTGSVSQIGSGNTTLASGNSYSGGTLITAGTLTGSATSFGSGAIADNAALVINQPADATLANVVNGTGTLLKAGAGTLALTSANTYTGGTTISAGTLQLGAGGTSGSIVGNVLDNAVFAFNRSDAVAFNGAISGTGSVSQLGSGNTILASGNGYSGGTLITAGALTGSATSFGSGVIADNAALVINQLTDATFANVVNGTGTLLKTGAGTLALTGANTYSGGTTISAGTLQLGNGGTSGSIVGNVLDNAALAFNRSDAVAFNGAISGTGSVSQLGAGNTTLASGNSYSGGTLITAGTLTGSATSFGSGVIADDATLVINQPTDASFANVINGTGALVKTGAAALNLTGISLLSGATTVATGTLSVTGSIANSVVTVNSGGILTGTGTVGGMALQSGAVLAPGNDAIGNLSVNGNFAQAAGATYKVEVNSASTASDHIAISGAATIANGSNLAVTRIGTANYTLGTRYDVLTANGGVTGTYTLSGDIRTAFVQLFTSYDANNVYLVAQQVRSFTTAGLTPNQVATAGGLDTLPLTSGLHNAIAQLPTDLAAQGAFDQLSGEIHASIKTASLEDSRYVREAAVDRMRGAFCSIGASGLQTDRNKPDQQVDGGCAPASDERVIWGQGYGSWGHVDGDGNAAKLKHDIGGFLMGVDAGIGGWRVGVLGGYSHSTADVNVRSSSSKTHSYHAGAYAGTQWGSTALRLGGSYSWNDIDTNRTVTFAGFADSDLANYHSHTAQAFGELGQRIALRGGAIEPFASVAYVNVHTNDFQERGGVAALSGQSDNAHVTFSTLGVRADTNFSYVMRFRGMVGWRHTFGDTTPSSTNALAGSSAFTVSGVPIGRNVAAIDTGVEVQLASDLTFGTSYSGQFATRSIDNGVRANLNWKF